MIDVCYRTVIDESRCADQTLAEACDGSNVPTCASQGYGDGSAACTTSCTFDPSGCGPKL